MSASSSRARRSAAGMLLRVDAGAFAGRLLGDVSGGAVRVRVLGVLRWRRLLDAALSCVSRRPLDRLDPEVATVLRLGLFEGLILGVPRPIATDAAVRLTGALRKKSAGGYVNAVLRRAFPEGERLRAEGELGVRLSHPEWLVERWVAAWGVDRTQTVLEADQTSAPLWLWLAPGEEADQTAWRAHPWIPGAIRANESPAPAVDLLRDGRAYAQDPASQAVAHAAVQLLGRTGGRTVVDMCAAPGGKSVLMRKLLPDALVVAGDVHLGRVGLVSRLADRMRLEVATVAMDARRIAVREGRPCVTLIDAPCTGTGTLRRHPDLRWRLNVEQVGRAAELQRALLRSAVELLGTNDTVLYTTCSVEPEENEQVVASVGPGFQPVSLPELLSHWPGALRTEQGGVRLLPAADHDGFVFHALRRRRAS